LKVRIERKIELDDVSMTRTVLPSALLRIFQDAAIVHSTQVGYSTRWFADNGQSWILKELAYEIHSPVKLHDELTILTWTRGLEKIRGSREFKILRGEEHVISATSTWIFIDTRRRRPMRVPKEMFDAFEIDEDHGLRMPKNTKESEVVEQETRQRLAINYRDFDINGHVNNTAYASYLQSAVHRGFDVLPEFSSFSIDFKKEITSEVKDVEVVLMRTGSTIDFKIMAEDTLRAEGIFGLRG
jgi:acyl-ACP thioesterase